MSRRNLLLCFDAFGTLFTPRRPISEQYAAVARECGLDGLTVSQVNASFKTAFSQQLRAHPNYGKASGMGAEKWWTSVIFATFQPLILPGQLLPSELAPRLLHRFSSGDGYCLMGDDLPTLIGTIKSRGTRQLFDRVVVGVITNSDDRAPTILSSLGMNVSPLRYGSPDISLAADARSQNHIDFHCLSYDVGIEKPDRLIFDAAESMAREILHAGNGVEDEHTAATKTTPPLLKIFVGDEFEKDVLGALGAGWHAVQLHDGYDDGHITHTHLNNYLKGSFRETFPESIQSPVSLSTDSLSSFLKWLNEY